MLAVFFVKLACSTKRTRSQRGAVMAKAGGSLSLPHPMRKGASHTVLARGFDEIDRLSAIVCRSRANLIARFF